MPHASQALAAFNSISFPSVAVSTNLKNAWAGPTMPYKHFKARKVAFLDDVNGFQTLVLIEQ